MSLKYENPRTLTATDMFMWWCKEKIRKKRHLRILYATSHSKDTILISRNGEELDWLRKNVLVLAEQIEKLERIDSKLPYFTGTTKEIYAKKTELYDAQKRIIHLEQVDHASSQVVMSESKFKKILYAFNQKARDAMINDAKVVNMRNRIGFLYVQKIARDNKHASKSLRMPNWNESKKYKQELIDQGIQIKDDEHPDGRKWIVYYDDDYYLRVSWTKKKGASRVKNHPFYNFEPSAGVNGTKKQLSNANMSNPFLHKTYFNRRIYYPRLDPNYIQK